MASKALVVGSGVNGLRTTIELLRNHIPTILHSPIPPSHPATCSVGAGGLWMPYKSSAPQITTWSRRTLLHLLHRNQHPPKNDDRDVEIVPVVLPRRNAVPEAEREEWTRIPELNFRSATAEEFANGVAKERSWRVPSLDELSDAGYGHCLYFDTPIVDAPRMIASMIREIESHELTVDVNLETGEYYASLDDMICRGRDLGCNLVFNCTGLGSRVICKDETLVGGRGVILHYDRRRSQRRFRGENDVAITVEQPPWGSATEPCYLIPRGDILVVGGSFYKGDGEVGVREEERKRLEGNAWLMGVDTKGGERSVGEWTGFRPFREGIKVEAVDVGDGMKVVHNYGHGGSGWTLFVGAAEEAVKLATRDI